MSDERPRWGDTHGHPGCYGCQMCFECVLDELEVDRPTLFLDIDGVLNSMDYLKANPGAFDRKDVTRALDPAACARLEAVLTRTNAVIVVSSVWRLNHSRGELQRFLHQRGAHSAQVVGVIPHLCGRRGQDIQGWMDDQPILSTRYAIVDDDSDMEHLMDKLVKTSFQHGLLDEHVERLVAMLNGA